MVVTKTMDFLSNKFNFLFRYKGFETVTGLILLINPLALLFQLLSILRTENAEGVSLATFCIFLMTQGATVAVAIKSKEKNLFVSMVLSVIITFAIIGLVIIKNLM